MLPFLLEQLRKAAV